MAHKIPGTQMCAACFSIYFVLDVFYFFICQGELRKKKKKQWLGPSTDFLNVRKTLKILC